MLKTTQLTKRVIRKLRIAKRMMFNDIGVIALKSRSKAPDPRFCPKGSHNATTDLEVVSEWLRTDDRINLAAVLKDTPFLVVDVDGPKGKKAAKALGILPKTLTVDTPNGSHRYYRHGGKVKGSRIALAPELDIIASGYTLLPGCEHPDGGDYVSLDWHQPIAKLPDATVKAIAGRKSTERGEKNAHPERIVEGQRNDRLTKIAGSLRRQGFGADMIKATLHVINERQCDTPLPDVEIDTIGNSIGGRETASDALFGSLEDVLEKKPEFLWYPWLVKGAVTIMEGMPDQGKSFLTMKIATEVSRGGELPGEKKVEAGNVLVLNPEDDAGYTIKPRLRSMGADLSRVRYGKKLFNFTDINLAELQQEIETHDIKLVTVDPLTAFLGEGVDIYRDNEVRGHLIALAEIASQSRCSFIVVRHLTKSSTGDPLTRGIGSIGFTAFARSVIIVGQDPDDPELRAMAHVKMNIARKGMTQTFTLSGGNAREGEMPEFQWCGTSDYTAFDIAAGPKREPGRPPAASAEAERFLRQQLSGGPKTVAWLNSQVERRSITSERTLRRVANEIDVQRVTLEGEKAWALPAKMSP